MPLPVSLAELADRAAGAFGPMRTPKANGLPAVRWLSMGQLARTGLEVVQASAFARFADKRESMAASPREFYRLMPTGEGPDIWVDYVADTGDGFDATFATACCVADVPGLTVTGGVDGRPVEFPGRPPQADLLVLGGDEVYPVASAAAYEIRLNEVLRAAGRVAGMASDPPVLALPGNHDWYDGLGAFRRNFCESWVLRDREHRQGRPQVMEVPPTEERDDVGGWGAFQSRSYSAVQLSPRWWLWTVDSQLDAPIDAEQLAYFRDAARLLGDADVVLCTATPSWYEAAGEAVYAAMADTPLYTLLWFVDRVLGTERGRVRLMLTGDEHNYAHYSPTDTGVPGELAPELVTCGGGGAYLASTHHLDDTLRAALQPWPSGSGQSARYRLSSCYPDRDRSRGLAAGGRFLSAAWRNGLSLPVLLGSIDFLLFLLFATDQVVPFLTTAVVVAALLGLYASSGVPNHPPRRRKWPTVARMMLPHALTHIGIAVGVAELLELVAPGGVGMGLWFLYPLAFVLLAVLGTVVFVTYLHLADQAGCHRVEAFSGLRIDGFKSHLRLQIDDNRIRVHVLGMDEVPDALLAADIAQHVPSPHLVDVFEVRHSLAPAPATAPATPPATPSGVQPVSRRSAESQAEESPAGS